MIKEIRKISAIMVAFVSLANVGFASPKDTTPTVDASEKVYDFAELLSDSEEKSIYNEITGLIDEYNLDAAVVTINYNNKSSAKSYAEDFYDYNDFGVGSTKDGLIFLIDMDNREMWISTTGTAQLIYDDTRIDNILDAAYDEIADKNYYGCASEFVRLSKYYAGLGIPDSNKNANINENGDYYVYNGTGSDNDANFGLAFIGAGIVTLIFMIVALAKHRTVRKASEAKQYMKNLKITNKVDNFLHTHTTQVYIPPANDSSSSGGGSSTSFGSSGTSHGGGGRSF